MRLFIPGLLLLLAGLIIFLLPNESTKWASYPWFTLFKEKKSGRFHDSFLTSYSNIITVADKVYLDYLFSGKDALTNAGFELGEGGDLLNAPTYRLKILNALSKTNLLLAKEYAQHLLKEPATSLDERAFALVLYAKGGPIDVLAEDSFFEQHLSTYLEDFSFRNNPTVAYLEGFDVVVYSENTAFIPLLLNCISHSAESPATAYAAHLALDRLALNHPEKVAEFILENQLLFESQPHFLIADELMARINPLDQNQLTLFADYLKDLPEERFEALLLETPNFNTHLSFNWLTPTVFPNSQEIRQKDFAFLSFLETALKDPSFQSTWQQEAIAQAIEVRHRYLK